MSETPDTHGLAGLARQQAVLEERMKTMQAEYRSDLAELMRQVADRNAEMAALMQQVADRNAEMGDRMATATERMANSRWWQTAILIAAVALVGAVAGGLPALVALLASAAG